MAELYQKAFVASSYKITSNFAGFEYVFTAVTPALIGAVAASLGQAVFLGIACGAKIAANVGNECPSARHHLQADALGMMN